MVKLLKRPTYTDIEIAFLIADGLIALIGFADVVSPPIDVISLCRTPAPISRPPDASTCHCCNTCRSLILIHQIRFNFRWQVPITVGRSSLCGMEVITYLSCIV
jgi:hypothetical protein